MISQILNEEKISELHKLLTHYDKIVITCHVSPDGDAIGSSLGLYHLLSSLGKSVSIVTPDATPKSLNFLPGIKEIVAYSKYTDFGIQILANAELIFCLDFNVISRVDKMSDALSSSKAKKVLIDHHLSPGDFADLVISYPTMSSTCELLFRVICRLGLYNEINKSCAECLYTGMMTDTGNFSYNSNRADIYIIISELIKKGIDKDKIYTLAMNTSTEERLRLLGYSIYEKMKIFSDSSAALIALSQSDLVRFEYKKGDTESLVNVPLGIPEVKWSTFMREEDGYIKISLRSKGDFAVNKICEDYFNGGGHRNAAGGEFYGTMKGAIDKYVKILEAIKEQHDNK
ncbi:MAG: bifunctional oligoribonuclease/PAP phosphatase NrnA [Muribaculaceae bacterium]|nr:bifunctional oligoribonuclease/PAP phosphatase NrnA [Muribaculaceae bacterium]